MELVVRQGHNGLDEVFDDWANLFDSQRNPSPPASPYWWDALLGSLEYRRQDTWNVFCVYENGTLLAAIPAFMVKERIFGVYTRVLTVPCHGFYGDALLPDSLASDALWRLLRTLDDSKNRWDLYRCMNVPDTSPLRQIDESNGRVLQIPNQYRVWLPAGKIEERFRFSSSKYRSNLRRRERLLNECGEWSIQCVRASSRDNQALDEFFDLEHSGWKGREGTSIRARPDQEEFLRRLAMGYRRGSGVGVCLLHLRGQTIGGVLLLFDGDTVRVPKVAYDEAFGRFSPVQKLIEYVAGTHEELAIDMISDAPWMKPWGPRTSVVSNVLVAGPTLIGRTLLHSMKVRTHIMRPTARLIRNTFRRNQ